MEKLVYNVEEAARVLGVSKSFCYRLVEEKKIPAKKIGRRIVIPIVKLEEFVKE